MNDDLLGSLTARGIHTLHQLLNLPSDTLQSVTGNFPASRLSQVPNLSQIDDNCFFYSSNTFITWTCLTLICTLWSLLGSPTISADPNECETSKEGIRWQGKDFDAGNKIGEDIKEELESVSPTIPKGFTKDLPQILLWARNQMCVAMLKKIPHVYSGYNRWKTKRGGWFLVTLQLPNSLPWREYHSLVVWSHAWSYLPT